MKLPGDRYLGRFPFPSMTQHDVMNEWKFSLFSFILPHYFSCLSLAIHGVFPSLLPLKRYFMVVNFPLEQCCLLSQEGIITPRLAFFNEKTLAEVEVSSRSHFNQRR